MKSGGLILILPVRLLDCSACFNVGPAGLEICCFITLLSESIGNTIKADVHLNATFGPLAGICDAWSTFAYIYFMADIGIKHTWLQGKALG
eukprot:scaffold21508_cov18-Prasinocladus_malaysianus.AAC.1